MPTRPRAPWAPVIVFERRKRGHHESNARACRLGERAQALREYEREGALRTALDSPNPRETRALTKAI